METAETKAIAATILQQIGGITLMRLGINRKTISTIPPAECSAFDSGHCGGVQFKFTGCPKVRNGKVQIMLYADDTYRVVIMNQIGRILYDQKGIYCDGLSGPEGVIEKITG